jgi:uncharacterized membrane protein
MGQPYRQAVTLTLPVCRAHTLALDKEATLGPISATAAGRDFIGLATLASGAMQLTTGEFIRLVPARQAWMPVLPLAAYIVGVVLVVIGLALLDGRRVRAAGTALAALLLFLFVFFCAPSLFASTGMDRPYLRGFMWTNPLKVLALIGGAIVLAGKPRQLGAVLLAMFLIVGGVQHFVYSDFVTELVPAYMPSRRFWTYFAGVSLIAGGIGILLPRTARLAASLTGLMIFLWVLMLHIPRALAGPNHAFETAGAFEALALSGVALLMSRHNPA